MANPAQQPQNEIQVFDRTRVKEARRRAANISGDHDFLMRWCARNLADRITDVTRNFETALYIGDGGSIAPLQHSEKIETLFHMDFGTARLGTEASAFNADEEFLPLAENSLDLIINNFTLHSVNDLPGALVQIRRALKDDGLFIAAMPGGETLHELRAAIMQAELACKDGVSPRVFPFADKPQMGDLLSRAGFNLPVVDSEIITVSYENIFKLLHDLRGMGEGNVIAARDKTNPGKALFMETARLYGENFAEDDGRIPASFEMIFLIGWKPHESQQKPLRPGSAKTRLADALNTNEIGTGEKPV